MANEIVVIEVGTPGPPGAGITTAEKNALAPKAGPAFTGTATFAGPVTHADTVTITKTSAQALLIENGAGTNLIVVDTSAGQFILPNAMDLVVASDGGATHVLDVDGATGSLVSAGNLSAVDITALDDINVTDDIIGHVGMNIFFSIDAATSCRLCAGAGSPEGVVAAGKGSIYMRVDGGVGTSQYTKTSNDGGTTGWTATG